MSEKSNYYATSTVIESRRVNVNNLPPPPSYSSLSTIDSENEDMSRDSDSDHDPNLREEQEEIVRSALEWIPSAPTHNHSATPVLEVWISYIQ